MGYLYDIGFGIPAPRLYLTNATFAVQPAGREKVLREGRKNVHAFVTGTYYALGSNFKTAMWSDGAREVTYNPYKNDTFMREGEPVFASPLITMGSVDRPYVWAI